MRGEVDPKVRADVVACVTAGMSQCKAARTFGVARTSVKRWVKEYEAGKPVVRVAADPSRPVEPLPRTTDGRSELLENLILESLIEEVRALRQIGQDCQDPEFIRANPVGVTGYLEVLGNRNDRLVAILQAAVARRDH